MYRLRRDILVDVNHLLNDDSINEQFWKLISIWWGQALCGGDLGSGLSRDAGSG